MRISMMAKKGNIGRIVCGVVCAAIFFFPVYAVIIGGLKTNGQLMNDPFGLPNPVFADSYKLILLKNNAFWVFLGNSVLISSVVILLTLFASAAASLALSRVQFRGRELIYNFFIMGMLFPITVAILPLYLQLRDLGLLGTRFGLILAQTAFQPSYDNLYNDRFLQGYPVGASGRRFH